MVKMKTYKLYIYNHYFAEELKPITLKANNVNDAFEKYHVKTGLSRKYEGADVRKMYLMERIGGKLVPKQVYPK